MVSRTPERPPQKKNKFSYTTYMVVERREGYNMYTGFKGLLEAFREKRKTGASQPLIWTPSASANG